MKEGKGVKMTTAERDSRFPIAKNPIKV